PQRWRLGGDVPAVRGERSVPGGAGAARELAAVVRAVWRVRGAGLPDPPRRGFDRRGHRRGPAGHAGGARVAAVVATNDAVRGGAGPRGRGRRRAVAGGDGTLDC